MTAILVPPTLVPVAGAYAQAGITAPIAIARALNWTGNKARTQVARTLARDTGVGYGVIRKSLRTTPASLAKLTYEIGVSGAPQAVGAIAVDRAVRRASPAAFEKSAAADLPQRLAHELGQLFPVPEWALITA